MAHFGTRTLRRRRMRSKQMCFNRTHVHTSIYKYIIKYIYNDMFKHVRILILLMKNLIFA